MINYDHVSTTISGRRGPDCGDARETAPVHGQRAHSGLGARAARAGGSGLYRFTDSPAPPPTLNVNDRNVPITLAAGYVAITRTWAAGDEGEWIEMVYWFDGLMRTVL